MSREKRKLLLGKRRHSAKWPTHHFWSLTEETAPRALDLIGEWAQDLDDWPYALQLHADKITPLTPAEVLLARGIPLPN